MNIFLHYVKEYFFAERSRWFVWIPVLFGLGIGIYFILPVEPSKWLTLGIIEFMIISAYLGRHKPGMLFGLSIAAIIVLGFADIQLKALYLSKNEAVSQEDKLYLKGRITHTEYNYRGNPRFILEEMENYDGEAIPGRYKLTGISKKDVAVLGSCVELIASVAPLPTPVLPGGYQMNRKLFFEGIRAVGFVPSRVIPVDCAAKTPLLLRLKMFVENIRNSIVRKINEVLPADEAGIASAIVAGDKGGISQKIIQNYRDSGLAHFLSISGLHMSMIAGIMFFLVRLIISFIPPLVRKYNSKKIAAVFAVFISFVYLCISGAAIPSQRAFIMTFVVLLGVLFDRRAISMRMIAMAGLIVLIFSPQALISASFQMSFAAVVVLIAFYEKYASPLAKFMNGSGKNDLALPVRVIRVFTVYILGLIISDLVASVATLPFAVYHFNRIAIYTTLANGLSGSVIGFVIMPFVLLALILMPFGLEYLPLKIVGWGIGYVNSITGYTASLPHAGYQVVSMPFWGLLLIVSGGLWLCLWERRWRWWGIPLVIIGVFSIFTVRVPDVMIDGNAEVFAVKNKAGEISILPSRGNNFIKNVWLEKTANDKPSSEEREKIKAVYDGKDSDKDLIDMVCKEESCLYKDKIRIIKSGGVEIDGKVLDISKSTGAVLYLNENGVKVNTVRDDMGNRYWNK